MRVAESARRGIRGWQGIGLVTDREEDQTSGFDGERRGQGATTANSAPRAMPSDQDFRREGAKGADNPYPTPVTRARACNELENPAPSAPQRVDPLVSADFSGCNLVENCAPPLHPSAPLANDNGLPDEERGTSSKSPEVITPEVTSESLAAKTRARQRTTSATTRWPDLAPPAEPGTAEPEPPRKPPARPPIRPPARKSNRSRAKGRRR